MSEIAHASRALSALGLQALEVASLALPQVKCEVFHRFGPGVYIREVSIPANTFAIGHMQKQRHQNIMLRGCVVMFNEDGSTKELRAPLMFVGEPGRKVGYVTEDMVWLNVYATDETDADKAEALFIDKSEAWLADDVEQRRMASLTKGEDRADYLLALAETGFTQEQARRQTENTEDQVPFPMGAWPVVVGGSPIEGRGLFATADIKAGQVICPARIGDRRTPAGRYTNHAKNPNAAMVARGHAIALVALRDIEGCRGGQHGEEITVDYRTSIKEARKLAT